MRVRLLALLLGACSSSARPAEGPPARPGAQETRMTEGRPRDAAWGRLRVVSRALELELPELDDWEYDAGPSWVRLEHTASSSVLELWVARAERLVRPAECEARARLTHPQLWRPSAETTIEQRTLDLSGGFRTELSVGISPRSRESEVIGQAVAFGAAVGRCLAVHFTTRASGAGAELEIARRLELVTGRTIPSLTLRGVEDRIQTNR